MIVRALFSSEMFFLMSSIYEIAPLQGDTYIRPCSLKMSLKSVRPILKTEKRHKSQQLATKCMVLEPYVKDMM